MKRMSLFVLVLGVLTVAMAGCGMISTGESAAENATQIAEFDVPAGFSPQFGMDMGGMVMVGYAGASETSHIFLIQAPASAEVTQDQLEQSLRDALASSSGSEAVEATDVEEIPLTIRGEEVTGTVGTGTSGAAEGLSVRVLTVPFTGNGGPALLLYQTAEADWDQAAVDAFIASFR